MKAKRTQDVTKVITGHKTTDEWLSKQPIWHDSDMIKIALLVAVLAGGIGFVFGWSAGQPDLSGIVSTGLRG